jgi:predicted CXXCH cytochrome family protein
VNKKLITVGLLIAATAFAATWLWRSVGAIRAELAQPFNNAQAQWVGSTVCADCHADRHASWKRTYHRTMTQEASAKSVLGHFDGQVLSAWDGDVRPLQRDGKFFFETRDPASGQIVSTRQVERTVGSHRYQQYLSLDAASGSYLRQNYLWHVAEQRWVHLNAAFLGPDQQPFDAHISTWNNNCIFCHNTGPQPRMDNYSELVARARSGEKISLVADAHYDSKVAELGIACEACHGPGSEHVARNASRLRRWTLDITGVADLTIVDPARLDAKRSTQICGQCHGQRVPKSVAQVPRWIGSGPEYRAGGDLSQFVAPVFRDSAPPQGAAADLFSQRFWNDGTPRLTAYEYQGLLLSRCYRESGKLSCESCHSMHTGDVDGMLVEKNRGNAPCARCHEHLVREVSAHSHHATGSVGSLCYNCHMPNVVYGVMGIRRSHRIEVPDASANARDARPNACSNCHNDKSPQWVVEQEMALWKHRSDASVARGDGADPAIADLPATLLAGDPVQKAIAAYHLGSAATGIGAIRRALAVPYLLQALDDDYPAVRRFARASLIDLERRLSAEGIELHMAALLESFDFTASSAQRRQQLPALGQAWLAVDKSRLPAPTPDSGLDARFQPVSAVWMRLFAIGQAQEKQISIGE